MSYVQKNHPQLHKYTEAEYDEIVKLAEDIQGTAFCNDQELSTGTIADGCDIQLVAEEEHDIFECSVCNWYCEPGLMADIPDADENVCTDCHEEEEE